MSDYKELLKHSGNYLFANLATKALSFISIPVYTSLLIVEDYGVTSVFSSTVGIVTVLLTLNTEVAISRYYYDANDESDFKKFVGTSAKLTGLIFCLLSILLIIFVGPLSRYLDFEILLTLCIVPVSLFSIVNSFFQQIYQPLLKSRKIAVVSSIQAYLAFGLSVVFILLLNDKKYYGQVWGSIVAMVCIGTYYIKQIKPYFINSFDRKYIKYILNYSIPYLPYSLSGIIVAQLGKLIIGQQQGFESAGLYSFASNIAALMLLFIFVIHSAWNPFYFKYMNKKDYKSLDNDYDLIWRITLFGGACLSLFGKEIGLFLGRPEYATSLYLIPILVVGYCLYQWSYVYMRNVGYVKKTIWNAVVVVTSGISNIVLNSVLFTSFGATGVAFAFSLSYMIMLILSWAINKYILKQYVPTVYHFMVPFMISIILIVLGSLCDEHISSQNILLMIKIAIIMVAISTLFPAYIKKMYFFIRR